MAFQEIEHTADVGLRVSADSVAALFSEAASGMFSLIVAGGRTGAIETRDIRVEADDWAGLLVAWLRELLYLWHSENRRYCEMVSWTATDRAVVAVVRVATVDPDTHDLLGEIKAVTYHQVAVETDGAQWTARVIFDV